MLSVFAEASTTAFGKKLAEHVSHRISDERGSPSLRMSNLGVRCDRKLWYSINTPDLAEQLSGPTRFKFLFGDILEELLLFLAQEAGHEVTRQQEEVEIAGVKGHIDGFIDGVLVDCKSASTFSYRKFADHLSHDNDAFGYLAQLGGYAYALGQPRAAFLVVDKTLGNICLDIHTFPDTDYTKVIQQKKEMLNGSLPPRHYTDEPRGKSGNRGLGVACSYCSFKQSCWPDLRTFLYSTGPEYLTHVALLPRVPEV
jgi:hypothetical protein